MKIRRCCFSFCAGVVMIATGTFLTPLNLPAQEASPHDPNWWPNYEKGINLLEQNDLDAAEKQFKALLKEKDARAEGHYGLGLVYVADEPGSRKAEKQFERAIKINRDYGVAYYQLGVVKMHQRNQMFEARRYLELAVQKTPSLVDAWSELGRAENELWPYGGGLVGIYAKGVKSIPDSRQLYAHFINSALWQKKENEAVGLLKYFIARHPDRPYFRLELANLYFDMDKIDDSQALVDSLTNEGVKLSPCRVNLLKAKLQVAHENPADSWHLYEGAIAAIHDSLDALAVFNDAKYIMNDAEYHMLQTAPLDSHQVFYTRFWRSRDPLLATPENEAWAEFYRRLRYARQNYRLFIPGYDEIEDKYQDVHPYRAYLLHGQALLQAANLPKALETGREIDEMGLIYVRHGKPDREVTSAEGVPFGVKEPEYLNKIFKKSSYYERVENLYLFSPLDASSLARVPQATAGQSLYAPPFFANLPSNLSWRYNATDERPELVFHFKKWEGKTGWLMESIPYAVAGREVFDEKYGNLGRESFTDNPDHQQIEKLCRAINDETRRFAKIGLNSTTFDFEPETQPLPFPFELLTFKGDSGTTRVELYYAVTGQSTKLAVDSTGQFLDLQMFIGMYNQHWDEVRRIDSDVKIPLELNDFEWENSATIDRQTFTAPPGVYTCEVQLKDLTSGNASPYRFNYEFPNYDKDELQMSNLLISGQIVKPTAPAKFMQGDYALGPRMFSSFTSDSRGGVYFEIYNLGVRRNKSRFKIHCQIRPENSNAKPVDLSGYVFGISSKEDGVAPLNKEINGAVTQEKLYLNFDLGVRQPGPWQLFVDVEDLNSGTHVLNFTSLQIR